MIDSNPDRVKLLQRFLSKVTVGKRSECWLWTGTKIYGYGRIILDGKNRAAHHISLMFFKDVNLDIFSHKIQTDHICHNPSCVNPAHLRVCDKSQNTINRMKRKKNKSSNYYGVSKKKNGWEVSIKKNNKRHYLGFFANEKDAALAYDKASRKIHKEYGVRNFGN